MSADSTETAIHRKGRVTDKLPLFEATVTVQAAAPGVETYRCQDGTMYAGKALRDLHRREATFSAKISDRDTPPLARATDSETSHEAAEDIRPRRKSRKRILLEVFRAYGPQTAEEACVRAGLTVGGWKRVSELVSEGKLRRTGTTRPNASGSLADVLELVPTPP